MLHRYYGVKPEMDQYEFRRISDIQHEQPVHWGDRVVFWICAALLAALILFPAIGE